MIVRHRCNSLPAIKRKLTLLLIAANITFAIAATVQAQDRNSITPIISYLLFSDSAGGENMSLEDASRFLMQTTFGPTYNDIVSLSNSSFSRWINTQMSIAPTHTVAFLDEQKEPVDASAELAGITNWYGNDTPDGESNILIHARAADSSLLNVMMKADDQLRQRVAYALSQIFVVSLDVNNGIHERPLIYLDYYDMLIDNAFGNYRDLLEEVTLHTVMGFYLTMRLNAPANTQVGPVAHSASFFVTSPDENYSRELMQLFSIGIYELNLDGTPVIDNGELVPSYTQDTIENFARIFTGWNYQSSPTSGFFNLGVPQDFTSLKSFDAFHDKGAKTLLNGEVLPANQTAVQDLTDTLDNIFNHQNVAPFISKLLIQHLVTSNPTPSYVERISNVFNGNNTNGTANSSRERGDLGDVITAILLDTEARNGHLTMPNTFGKYKEPFIRQISMWRALDAFRTSGSNFFDTLSDAYSQRLKQKPLRARSVFNFYQPDFSPPGVMTENGLLAPEGQLLDLESVINIASLFEEYTQRHHLNVNNNFPDSAVRLLLDTSTYEQLVPNNLQNPEDLVERLNLVLMAGAMSDEMKQVLLDVHDPSVYLVKDKWEVVIDLVNIILVSPQYWVQK